MADIASANRLATVGHSNDPWDGWDADRKANWRACNWIAAPYYVAVHETHRAAAVASLATQAIIPLGDRDASALLDIDTSSGESATVLFLRRAAMHLEEEVKAHNMSGDNALLQQINVMLANPGAIAVHPYLVRGVAGARTRHGEFGLIVCDGTLRVLHQGDGALHRPPDRVPVIVFLYSEPNATLASWSIYDR